MLQLIKYYLVIKESSNAVNEGAIGIHEYSSGH